MKRTAFLCLLLGVFFFLQRAQAQELIGIGGYGYNQTSKKFSETGNYLFGEARLMLPLNKTKNFRLGPYLGYIAYGSKTPFSDFLGQGAKAGVSLDFYSLGEKAIQHYFWNTVGLKRSWENYTETPFNSETKTNLIFLEGGISFVNRNYGWFSHHQGTWFYQHPVGTEKVKAFWDEEKVSPQPWDKRSLGLSWETGVVNFGRKIRIEPILKIGYGHEFGRQMNYYEYGGGLAFGVYKNWYREVVKVMAFERQDFKKIEGFPSERFNLSLVLNLSAFFAVL